ncbi:hypothetical protein ERO13_A09G035900v2 [Gossypium hirsutum]|uniref:Uncharacterized protein n=4 Tax=Gossypium TaxID=3633 RepID=A0A5J5UA52_GOSBA|nr:hypothetical protein ES319_A09G039600v1 [Gossypium barbadense]KAG4182308.1 hypothetical protein ERO13_A09G035900v2 [Gossypium hirsutum]TYH01308.1 hypothetical protein ES288_A09G048100v1 [Gossypium darwinii]TYI09067.1 hypothetical protein ES332_A09G045900v1 [Gossypium tomentosum]TYJ17282.1 hypothetical protein E1A91_A09G041800v1 [Gossypium mustelinum]
MPLTVLDYTLKDLERPYGGTTLMTWRPSVGISSEKMTFWCHSGLLQKLLAFSGC